MGFTKMAKSFIQYALEAEKLQKKKVSKVLVDTLKSRSPATIAHFNLSWVEAIMSEFLANSILLSSSNGIELGIFTCKK